MRTLSERYKELSEKSGRYPILKIEIYEGTRLNWSDKIVKTISGADYIKSASYSSGTTVKPNKFEIGTAYCAKFTAVLFSEIFSDLKYSQKIKVYTGFKDFENDAEEFVALGVFFIEEKELRSEGAYISARDIMMYSESSWFPYEISYPCTLTEVYKDVVRQMGGNVDEDYTLPVEATVLEAPYTSSDPNIIYVNGETELDGKPYTCRQVIAQIARTQLGNAYVDGDGFVKFYSYDAVGGVSDFSITEIRIEDESYSNLGVFYAYGDRTQEQVKGEETYGTIVFFTTLPIEDLNEGQYDQLKEQAQKACGWWWKGGQISRKGQGNAEPGDKIEYSGKYGNTNFFISGVVMEWANGSYDETLYSFAPTYEDSAYSSNNTDSSPSEVAGDAASSEGKGGVTIENGIIIQEADAKYLLHEYTELDYIAGNKIGYAGANNPVIMQNIPVCEFGAKTPNGVILPTITKDVDTSEQLPDVQTYTTLNFPNGLYIGNAVVTKLALEPIAFSTTATDWQFKYYCADGTTGVYETFTTDNRYPTGCFVARNAIWAPNEDYPYGYATVRYGFIYAIYNSTQYRTGVNTQYLYTLPFGSETEYNAAVVLTYEPVSLTEVTEKITEV